MVSRIRSRPSIPGLLNAKRSFSRATSSGEHAQASGSGSGSGSGSQSRDKKTQNESAVVKKPWADQPWPLIKAPLRPQNTSHPALNIANELTLIHNAMIRGLNAIFLQASHVQQDQDVADLLFLTQSWSAWLLDHHRLKEHRMLPGFEAVLGAPAGTLTILSNRSSSTTASFYPGKGKMMAIMEGDEKGKEVCRDEKEEEEDGISLLLHRVHAYTSATHADPQTYSATILEELLVALADALIPHFANQVELLASMAEMCLGSSASEAAAAAGRKKEDNIPAPLPIPMVTITRTRSNMAPSSGSSSTSPPVSPSSSTFSISSASTATSSSSPSAPTSASPLSAPKPSPPQMAALSLFPSPPRLQSTKPTSSSTIAVSSSPSTSASASTNTIPGANTNPNSNPSTITPAPIPTTTASKSDNTTIPTTPPTTTPRPKQSHPGTQNMVTIDPEAKSRLYAARARLDATARAKKLTQVYLSADAHATAHMDHFVVPPLMAQLRDVTFSSTTFSSGSKSSSGSRSTSGSRDTALKIGAGVGMGGGIGTGGGLGMGNAAAEWPRLSIPAVHAIVDRLAPRHAGAWRFLPCDVWGRPRELMFLGSGSESRGARENI
ncbi:hypothetical protein F4777DRAFT_81792 [Nemania sp. FL0916]|nr:hypothetical protein F4777DRAFT_81792 [Nemania sp. FL0916]